MTRTSAKMLDQMATELADFSGKKCIVVTGVRGCDVHFDGEQHRFKTFTDAWNWMFDTQKPYFDAWLAAL